jgi:hypothetical protein
MNYLKELLLELSPQQQAELEAETDLVDAGVKDVSTTNKALLAKKAREKQKQITNLSQSDDPIDRQIALLRRQIANLIAKKRARDQAEVQKQNV